jgi:hypothetical protein
VSSATTGIGREKLMRSWMSPPSWRRSAAVIRNDGPDGGTTGAGACAPAAPADASVAKQHAIATNARIPCDRGTPSLLSGDVLSP